MLVNEHTRIGAILRQQPGALEAIISISPKFQKLRNPLLRKLIANRTSIAMAAKMSGHCVAEFFSKLKTLGFNIGAEDVPEISKHKQIPDFIFLLRPEDIFELDVRDVLSAGSDPLSIINHKIKNIKDGQALKIINNFEPVPLILLLEKQGFKSYVNPISDQLVETYFLKTSSTANHDTGLSVQNNKGWADMIRQFEGRIQRIDVHTLNMPLPMVRILEAIESLPNEHALFVFHKRIPVVLFPELEDRGYEYRVKEISEEEVHLLIFKNLHA